MSKFPRLRIHSWPTFEEVRAVTDNLRASDKEEVLASSGDLAGLPMRALGCTPEVYVAYWDDEPVAVFGVYLSDGEAAPWFLGTPAIEGLAVARAMVAKGRTYLTMWVVRYGQLRNAVYAKNRLHIRYLRHLGCRFRHIRRLGPRAEDFWEFTYV